MEARYYQTDCLNSLWDYLYANKGQWPVCALPTGSGKAFIICEFIRQIMTRWQNQKVMMVTHRKKLIVQNAKTLRSIWNGSLGIHSAQLKKKDTIQPVIFAGIDSVNKPESFGHVHVVVVDECHLCDNKIKTRYRKFVDKLREKNPNLIVVGFSATPWRPGLGWLWNDGGMFDGCAFMNIIGDDFMRLVHEGYLVRLEPAKVKLALDVSEVHTVAGEYNEGELDAAVNQENITRAALAEAVEQSKGHNRKSWMIFGVSIKHCESICNLLNTEFGISCTIAHSKLPDNGDKNIEAFQRGEYTAIVSQGILTTGFDHPPADMLVMLRPTQSSSLWVQMLGRLTRPSPGKDYGLVLDFARNTLRLGPINDPLIPKPKGESKGAGAPIMKECPECHRYCYPSVRTCECGYEFKIDIKITATASEAELLKTGEQKIEVFAVDRVSYAMHMRRDGSGQPSLKVSYACGNRRFDEFVCFEHTGFPKHKAIGWWKARSDKMYPETIPDTLHLADQLERPTHIKVNVTNRFPEIVEFDFTGSAFDTLFGANATGTPPMTPIINFNEMLAFN